MCSRWGIVHTEKFWRENAKFVEANDFKLLKMLIALLKAEEEVWNCFVIILFYSILSLFFILFYVYNNFSYFFYLSQTIVCIALYDLGEFTRFYPNGRGVVKTLG